MNAAGMSDADWTFIFQHERDFDPPLTDLQRGGLERLKSYFLNRLSPNILEHIYELGDRDMETAKAMVEAKGVAEPLTDVSVWTFGLYSHPYILPISVRISLFVPGLPT